MNKQKLVKRVAGIAAVFIIALSISVNLGLFFSRWNSSARIGNGSPSASPNGVDRHGDEELAYLLVKLELKTRSELAAHFTRKQSPVPGVDKLYQRLLVKNLILPAAVAGRVFSDTVPRATGGRAWVKMVVDEPRNPKNRGDEIAMQLLSELRDGAEAVDRKTDAATYYAEPIKAKEGCLYCHGTPKGAPDPYFAQFKKEGWRTGQVIGAVISRVAPDDWATDSSPTRE